MTALRILIAFLAGVSVSGKSIKDGNVVLLSPPLNEKSANIEPFYHIPFILQPSLNSSAAASTIE